MSYFAPEMKVRLRLLGFSAYRINAWEAESVSRDIEIQRWWDWLEMLETTPATLEGSLQMYNRLDNEGRPK